MGLTSFLLLAAILFGLGLIGALTHRSVIVVFLSIELMLNAANLLFLAFARSFSSLDGAVMALFVLAVAAAEAAVGLSITVAYVRKRGTTAIDEAQLLRW